MARFLKDQFPVNSAASTPDLSDDEAATPDAEKKEAAVAAPIDTYYQGIDQHVHISLRQMYHIFDYFTQESFFGKQVKDIRSELDEAKRQSVFTNLNHDALKEKCTEAFQEQEEQNQRATEYIKSVNNEFS